MLSARFVRNTYKWSVYSFLNTYSTVSNFAAKGNLQYFTSNPITWFYWNQVFFIVSFILVLRFLLWLVSAFNSLVLFLQILIIFEMYTLFCFEINFHCRHFEPRSNLICKLLYQMLLWFYLSMCGCFVCHGPVGRAVIRSSLVREVWGSNFGPVKSDTVLPTARHRCDIISKGAVLLKGAVTRKWTPQACYTLRRITASIIKDLIWFHVFFWFDSMISFRALDNRIS